MLVCIQHFEVRCINAAAKIVSVQSTAQIYLSNKQNQQITPDVSVNCNQIYEVKQWSLLKFGVHYLYCYNEIPEILAVFVSTFFFKY